MDVQVRIPPAMAAVHNFIRIHDPEEINDFTEIAGSIPAPAEEYGDLAAGVPSREERARATADRDEIAEQMFADYQAYVHALGL
jgi:hypothetical protein